MDGTAVIKLTRGAYEEAHTFTSDSKRGLSHVGALFRVIMIETQHVWGTPLKLLNSRWTDHTPQRLLPLEVLPLEVRGAPAFIGLLVPPNNDKTEDVDAG